MPHLTWGGFSLTRWTGGSHLPAFTLSGDACQQNSSETNSRVVMDQLLDDQQSAADTQVVQMHLEWQEKAKRTSWQI